MAAVGSHPCNHDVLAKLLESFRNHAQTPEQLGALGAVERQVEALRDPFADNQWIMQALDQTIRVMIRVGLPEIVDSVVNNSGCTPAWMTRMRLNAMIPDKDAVG